MPGDPLKPVTPGSRWEPSAATLNAWSAAARKALGDARLGSQAELNGIINGSVCMVRNENDTLTCPQYGNLMWIDALIDPADNLPEFKSRLALRGSVGTVTGFSQSQPFFIAQEPIPPHSIGRCILDGFTIAKVNVTNTAHRFVKLSTSMDYLESTGRSTGYASIHFRELTVTGEQYCIIRLGPLSNLPPGEDPGGTGGGGCCCASQICLRVPSDPLVEMRPEYYRFRPGAMYCNCSPAYSEAEEVKLYKEDPDDDLLWVSVRDPVLECYSYPPCQVTADWLWTAGTPGNCSDLLLGGTISVDFTEHPGDPGNDANWLGTLVSNDCTPCANGIKECSGDVFGYAADWIAAHSGIAPRGIHEIDCVDGVCSGGSWSLTGVDDEECSCTPVQPDYPGSLDGQTAQTTCDAFKTVGPRDTLYESYWRLIIDETVDYYGCTQTRIEFLINEIVVYTAYLTHQGCNARPFCRDCINSFTAVTCKGPCQNAPAVICLEPAIDSDVIECTFCEGDETPQKYWAVHVSGLGVTSPGFILEMGTEIAITGLAGCGAIYYQETGNSTPGSSGTGYVFYNGAAGVIIRGTLGTSIGEFTYVIDQDVTTGDGCDQILTLQHSATSTGGAPTGPDGSYYTLYPISTNLPPI